LNAISTEGEQPMPDDLFVTREVKIAAPPGVVFDYLTEPAKLMQWNTTAAEFDARVGGAYRFTVAGSHVASGEVLELDPPRRLAYTWGWEDNDITPPGSSTVVFELEQDGDYTIVRLTHRDLPSKDACDAHAEGWEHYLPRLSLAAAGGDPGPDPWAQGSSD